MQSRDGTMQDPRHGPIPRLAHRGWKARKYLLLPYSSREWSLVSCAVALALGRSDIPRCRGWLVPVRYRSTVGACCENGVESESAPPPVLSGSVPAKESSAASQ